MTEAIKKNILFGISFVAFVGLRIGYRLLGPKAMDAYGYFERAMIRTKEQSIPLTGSGVAYAYTGALSDLFRFTGNRIEAVWGYQMILQTVAVCLLVTGCYLLFGKLAAYFGAVVSSILPYLIASPVRVSVENFFLFFFSLLFFMISVFYAIAARNARYRDNILLIPIGFTAGVLCIWHGFSLSVLGIIVFVICAGKEKKHVITIASRFIVLLLGIFLGGFCTLMKYAEVTGTDLKDRFGWWSRHLLSVKDGLWQEMEPWVCVYIGGVILMSGIFGFFSKKKKEQTEEVTPVIMTEETDETKESDDKETENNHKVTYLDNPLPVPKKHEKRTMDFAVDGYKDDFDIQIDENDDFDV